MHRLTAILLAASALSLIFVGLVLPASLAQGVGSEPDRVTQGDVGIGMSATDNGPQQRNFISTTNRVYAVVSYQQAVNESFMVRFTDLVGIRVSEQVVGPLAGDGQVSVAAGVAEFLGTYGSRYTEERDQVAEDTTTAADYCANRPPVPDPWPIPEPTPGPGPTPRRDPYLIWAELMVNTVEQIRSTTAEMTRTLQAYTTLPNIAQDMAAARDDLDAARAAVIAANTDLAGMSRLLLPATDVPDPDTACQAVATASSQITGAIAGVDAVLASLPADVGAWRLPLTVARYDERQFAGCSQYKTDLIAYVGGRPSDTPATSALWTVGDPGPPALIFPAADLTDRGTLGGLGLRLPQGVRYLYAQGVTVPGTPHDGTLSAYVTDANCLPVSENVRLWVSPEGSGGASVSPDSVNPDDGDVAAQLHSGDDVTDVHNGGWAIACAGAGCAPMAPTPAPGRQTPGQAWGSVRFEVVGPAFITNTLLKINPEMINRVDDEEAGISLQVHDRNGRPVADGTGAQIWLDAGSPGYLAYDRQRAAGGERERVSLGKRSDVEVAGGLTRYPASDDPGFVNLPRLYLFAGDNLDGPVTVCYQVDSVENCQPDAITIYSSYRTFLPAIQKLHDRYGTATPTRWRPTLQSQSAGEP